MAGSSFSAKSSACCCTWGALLKVKTGLFMRGRSSASCLAADGLLLHLKEIKQQTQHEKNISCMMNVSNKAMAVEYCCGLSESYGCNFGQQLNRSTADCCGALGRSPEAASQHWPGQLMPGQLGLTFAS
jgi:hypothetical protein